MCILCIEQKKRRNLKPREREGEKRVVREGGKVGHVYVLRTKKKLAIEYSMDFRASHTVRETRIVPIVAPSSATQKK
jgi:hypothetical protein